MNLSPIERPRPAVPDSPAAASPLPTPCAAPSLVRPGAGRTVLVVDDEPDTLEVIQDILQFEGFRVITVSNGKDGVAVAVAEPPDLILLDLMMPEMNGFDVCAALTHAGLPFRPPILIVTGLDALAAQARDLCDLFAVNEFLYKPFSRAALVQRVYDLLQRPNVRRAHP